MNLGIICEFNPLHEGHRYLINSVKGRNDSVICAMSGNFVQRGEFAVYSKFDRAETAVENGADLVIEIPTLFSTLSAQGFAKAGVRILESTGVCDRLVFGAECDDIEKLKSVADEIRIKDGEIKAELEKGLSYPKARQNVISSPILDSPNNILAMEYLGFTSLEALAVKRIGKGHDSDDSIYSSSQIRKSLAISEIASMKNCEKAVLYKLRTMNAEDFKNIEDVSEGLENRIVNAVKTAKNLDALYDSIKTKRYTHSRIRRIILRAFLSINKDMPREPKYLRILAFNERGREILSKMKSAAKLPVITKFSDAKSYGGEILRMFEQECRFTDIYNLGFSIPQPAGEEKTRKIFIDKSKKQQHFSDKKSK